MTTEKNLGIWMDHLNAHLMELTSTSIKTTFVTSTFTHDIKEESLQKGEKLMHNKEQQGQAAYYKILAEHIVHYQDVLLFGPTDAKTELCNVLKSNNNFDKIKITVLQSDKMTEPQEHAFVRDYFIKR